MSSLFFKFRWSLVACSAGLLLATNFAQPAQAQRRSSGSVSRAIQGSASRSSNSRSSSSSRRVATPSFPSSNQTLRQFVPQTRVSHGSTSQPNLGSRTRVGNRVITPATIGNVLNGRPVTTKPPRGIAPTRPSLPAQIVDKLPGTRLPGNVTTPAKNKLPQVANKPLADVLNSALSGRATVGGPTPRGLTPTKIPTSLLDRGVLTDFVTGGTGGGTTGGGPTGGGGTTTGGSHHHHHHHHNAWHHLGWHVWLTHTYCPPIVTCPAPPVIVCPPPAVCLPAPVEPPVILVDPAPADGEVIFDPAATAGIDPASSEAADGDATADEVAGEVDAETVPVKADAPIDLLVDYIELVAPGDLAADMGPKYRVWIINNGPSDAAEPFNVSLIATDGDQPTETSPFVTRRVASMKSGERLTVELQLPAEVMQMQIDAEGQPVAFQNLFAGIDTNQEYEEIDEENNALAVTSASVRTADMLATADK
ncbi:MAG: hypothetical protein KDB23_07835 [Planctomycetales bacterium]|nr:hypothetical protein [Planctomycetales bacterium]